MSSRFILPAAVAMALHALAFFGFQPSSAQPLAVTEPPAVSLLQHVVFEEPPAPADPDQDTAAAAPRAPDIPRGDEDLSRPVPDDSRPFVIPVENVRPGPISPVMQIPAGSPVGTPGVGLSGPGGVIDFTKLDNPPRTRLQVPPAYPYEASQDGRRGEVWVRFTVNESGRVLEPQIIRSSDTVFEAPTLKAIAKWRFEPGRRNGRAVRFQMLVPVKFNVNP